MRVLFLCLVVVAAAPVAADEPPEDAAVRNAIVAAVRARMGEDAEVEIDTLRLPAGWSHTDVQARPDPSARLGAAVRFSLGTTPDRPGAATAWTGAAEAHLRVVVEHLHTRHAVSRGATLGGEDVELVRHEVDGPLRAWPGTEAVGRSRALRDFAPGTCLARSSLAVVPLVRAGQDVRGMARIGGVEAEAMLVAGDPGDVGDVIRVVNPQSRRALKARIVGAGVVEVIHD